jgi:pimeloyl-ACP methyl ester carboxylesterase
VNRPSARRRLAAPLLLVVLTTVLALVAPAATARPAGPRLQEPKARLAASLDCTRNIGRTGRKPAVILVHGTGTNSKETWTWNLKPRLRKRGYAVCTVDVPAREWRDVQANVEYVVHAIRVAYRRSDRRVAVIGHSQGAFLPSYALRVWPDLARKVKDFVGYAGTYTYGSDTLKPLCAAPCAPAAHQLTPGSNLLAELAEHPLPKRPSYTAFSTAQDEIVTPQPKASRLRAPGVRNYVLQDLCPTDVADHIAVLASRAFYQLTFDALRHRGPGRIRRVKSPVCGPDPMAATGVTGLPTYGLGFLVGYSTRLTPEEPPLRRYWRRL